MMCSRESNVMLHIGVNRKWQGNRNDMKGIKSKCQHASIVTCKPITWWSIETKTQFVSPRFQGGILHFQPLCRMGLPAGHFFQWSLAKLELFKSSDTNSSDSQCIIYTWMLLVLPLKPYVHHRCWSRIYSLWLHSCLKTVATQYLSVASLGIANLFDFQCLPIWRKQTYQMPIVGTSLKSWYLSKTNHTKYAVYL